jgi:hypothetical protein
VGQRIGIVCPGRNGDVAESTGFIPYMEDLWGPDPEVHWFVQKEFAHVLEHLPITLRVMKEEYATYVAKAAAEIARAEDFDVIHYTAPWLNMRYVFKIPLPMIPRYVLDAGRDFLTRESWRPHVVVTDKEKEEVDKFQAGLPAGKRILLETGCFSHQGDWDEALTEKLVQKLRPWNPLYLTASFGASGLVKKYGGRAVGLDSLNFRQLAEMWNYCDMYIGVPSGTASVTCAEGCKDAPRIEYLTPDRCPSRPGAAPDWGGRGAYSYSRPGDVLAKAAEVVKAISAPSKQRRRYERRLRRRKQGIRQPLAR